VEAEGCDSEFFAESATVCVAGCTFAASTPVCTAAVFFCASALACVERGAEFAAAGAILFASGVLAGGSADELKQPVSPPEITQ
jgi:hypothetical protein